MMIPRMSSTMYRYRMLFCFFCRFFDIFNMRRRGYLRIPRHIALSVQLLPYDSAVPCSALLMLRR